MRNFNYIPQNYEIFDKIEDHNESDKHSDLVKCEMLLMRMRLLYTKLLENYAYLQAKNNVKKGIAGEVELWN